MYMNKDGFLIELIQSLKVLSCWMHFFHSVLQENHSCPSYCCFFFLIKCLLNEWSVNGNHTETQGFPMKLALLLDDVTDRRSVWLLSASAERLCVLSSLSETFILKRLLFYWKTKVIQSNGMYVMCRSDRREQTQIFKKSIAKDMRTDDRWV